jgi:hypothetical protein
MSSKGSNRTKKNVLKYLYVCLTAVASVHIGKNTVKVKFFPSTGLGGP